MKEMSILKMNNQELKDLEKIIEQSIL